MNVIVNLSRCFTVLIFVSTVDEHMYYSADWADALMNSGARSRTSTPAPGFVRLGVAVSFSLTGTVDMRHERRGTREISDVDEET